MIRTLLVIIIFVFAGSVFAEDKEGGIIGTGVIGQITALDQFEISGMQFDFAPDIELKNLSSLEELRMGMTLAVSAGRDGEAWQIKELRHMPILTGPITGPEEVMGIPVIGKIPSMGTVQIDGFWSENGIVATRVVEVEQDHVQVSGVYDGRDRINLVPISGVSISGLVQGQNLTVSGKYRNGEVFVESAAQGPFMGDSPDLVLLEGYFHLQSASDSFSLHGVGSTSSTNDTDIGIEQLVRRCSVNGRMDFLIGDLSQSDAEIVRSFCISASNSTLLDDQ
ncbi:MAG: hypothetical protein AAF478_00145 [Pseudomonadota bacterium]